MSLKLGCSTAFNVFFLSYAASFEGSRLLNECEALCAETAMTPEDRDGGTNVPVLKRVQTKLRLLATAELHRPLPRSFKSFIFFVATPNLLW